MNKYQKLYKLAKLVQEVDGDFAMFMRYVDNEKELTFVTATEIVQAWSSARNDLAGKEISIIYG